MSDDSTTCWGIHAGRTGDAENLFLHSACVALGFNQLGDLGAVKNTREAFKQKVAETYPEKKKGAIPNIAGQVYRFVHEMRVGDLVVFPAKRDRTIHLGRVDGEYQYDPGHNPTYPNTRSVKWLNQVPRTRFSQGALYEIGSAMSFFQVRTYADEFLAAINPRVGTKSEESATEDDTVALVAEDIEQTTRDFVLKQLSRELKGHPFAEFVAHVLEAMGYRTRVSPEGPDGGIDIIAHKDELGFEPPIIKVQVKSTDGSVGDPAVSALYGKVSPGEFGLLVTLGTITSQARHFARSKSNLRLIDGDAFVELVLHHYDQFDSRYKGLIPLKRVFVPETLDAVDA